MKSKKVKLQKYTVEHAIGTAAGLKSTTINVDTDYTHITGINVREITDGNLVDEYAIGLKNGKFQALELTDKSLLETDQSIRPNHRLYDLLPDMPREQVEVETLTELQIVNGANIAIQTEFDSTVASDALKFVVTLRLEVLEN